ncbi:MAG: RNA polymerase sigma factor [Planctomycetota bacterium]
MFETFVRSETPTFVGFFRRLGAAADEAEDLTQELFVRLVRGAPRYEPKDRLEAFCFRTARNVWIDDRRAKGVRRTVRATVDDDPLARVASEAPEPDVPAGDREEARLALGLLAELPDAQRLVFELGVLQEMPYAEIARTLDIPVGTVKSRMFHAVKRLRELLERPSRKGGGGSAASNRAANRAF